MSEIDLWEDVPTITDAKNLVEKKENAMGVLVKDDKRTNRKHKKCSHVWIESDKGRVRK